jgi:hypothetical protein
MNHPTMFSRLHSNRWARPLTGTCVVGAIAVVLAIASSRTRDAASAPLTPLAQPPLPKVQLDLVHAERFQVEKPFRNTWHADQPLVNSGWLLVLSGDPALFRPRQIKEPVLYVGAQTAQRINSGPDGKLVVLVPGDFQLEDAPIFFGAEALPEELRQGQIDAQLESAREGGAKPPTKEAIENATNKAAVEKATAKAAAWGNFTTEYELRLRAIELVEQYSPKEQDLISGWRAPRTPGFTVVK